MNGPRSFLVAALGVVAAAIAVVGVGAASDAPAAPNWLVQVAHVARQDLRPQDQSRIDALKARRDELPADDPKRAALDREVQRESASAQERRPFIVYGMRAPADAQGRPLAGSRGLAAFVLPPDVGNRRALGEIEPGRFVLVPEAGCRPLLSVSGRAWVEARRVTPSDIALDWGAIGSFAEMPALPETPPAECHATLRFQGVKERDSGEGYRYTLSFRADPPAESSRKVVIWYEVRYPDLRGEVIGPVLDKVELERDREGRFARSFGFDVVAPRGTTLEPDKATAQIVAAAWE